jgi:hypothetical protein
MAALSSKVIVSATGLPTIGLLANKGRILAVGAVNFKVEQNNAHRDFCNYIRIPVPVQTHFFGFGSTIFFRIQIRFRILILIF